MSLTLIQSRHDQVHLSVELYLLQSLLTPEGTSPAGLEALYPVRQLRDVLGRGGCQLTLF